MEKTCPIKLSQAYKKLSFRLSWKVKRNCKGVVKVVEILGKRGKKIAVCLWLRHGDLMVKTESENGAAIPMGTV